MIKYRICSSVLLKEADSLEETFRGEYNKTLGESYIALAAPSLTGKTQAAFSICSKIPLYFVFDSTQSQRIYSAFQTLTCALEDCALLDIPIMRKHLISLGKRSVSGFPFIDRNDFPRLLSIKSNTIGFLMAIMEDSEAFVSTGRPEDWFLHFSRTRSIDFQPASIHEFKFNPLSKSVFSKYFIFMDEFNGDVHLVFLRNLFRYLEISCVVASTNAKIVNLIGMSTRASSREDGPRAWCLTFPRLPSISVDMIEANSDFVESANLAIEKANEISEINGYRMINLLKYLKEDCLVSRPGFAFIIMNEVIKLIKEKKFNFEDMFEGVLNSIRFQLSMRKPQAFTELNANLILMLSGGIPNESYSEYVKLNDLIDGHFYYLVSPKGDVDSPFLLSRRIKTYANKPKENIIGYGPNVDPFVVNSYFDIKETLLMITCLYKGLSDPVMLSFDTPVPSRRSDNYNTGAQKRLGDAQENLALMTICDSTHKTIRGTGIVELFEGIIWNFNFKDPYVKIEFVIPDLGTTKSLENIKVPFLLPEVLKTSESFKEMCKDSKIHFGTYSMTKNQNQVDGVFDLIPVDNGNGKKVRCIVEAKNRKGELPKSKFLEIIKKGLLYAKNNPETEFPLHLTFTSTFKNFNDSNKTAFELKKLALEHEINFLKLEIVDKNDSTIKIELRTLSKALPFFPEPKMSSVVIDVETLIAAINSIYKQRKAQH